MLKVPGIVASKAKRQGPYDSYNYYSMDLLFLLRHRPEVPYPALEAYYDNLEVQQPAVGSRGNKPENLGSR